MTQAARKVSETDRIRELVVGFLEKKSKLPATSNPDAFNYVDSGHIDSMGIMNFIVSLESEFGIEITEADMESPAFRTVGGIVALVAAKKAR